MNHKEKERGSRDRLFTRRLSEVSALGLGLDGTFDRGQGLDENRPLSPRADIVEGVSPHEGVALRYTTQTLKTTIQSVYGVSRDDVFCT